MKPRSTAWQVRERLAIHSLLGVGVFVVFILTFVLALQSAGLFVGVWRVAEERLATSSPGPAGSATPSVTPLVCQFHLPAQSKGETKPRSANQLTAQGVCQSGVAKEGKPPESASTPNSSPNTADTLSALGVVVALVTLLLTLGSTYLNQKQQEIAQLLDKEAQRQGLEECLILVQRDCFAYFMRQQPSVGAQQTLACAIYLRGLQSADASIRKDMNSKVSNLIGRSNLHELPGVRTYVTALEHYLRQHVMAPNEESGVNFIR